MSDNEVHWQEFYSSPIFQEELLLPSQFGAFVSNEIARNSLIIDVGCGNGRDSLYFGRHGFTVIGIDRSEKAISLCKKNAPKNCLFMCCDLSAVDFKTQLDDYPNTENKNVIIYSRFFLHAIDRQLQRTFLSEASSLQKKNLKCFLEFRIDKDKERKKETPEHYRRYVDLTEFEKDAADFSWKIDYKNVGTGLAKYRQDDAYVARYTLSLD